MFRAFPADEQGLSVDFISSRLGGKLRPAEIRAAVDFLSTEGHLYSTIDEDHYCSTYTDN